MAISLALLVLLSNIGLAINTHFCGGEAIETTFSLGLRNPDCNMMQSCEKKTSEDDQFETMPCCNNQHQVIETDEMAKTQAQSSFNPAVFTVLTQILRQPLLIVDEGQTQHSEYPPPFFERDIQVLFQTFLI